MHARPPNLLWARSIAACLFRFSRASLECAYSVPEALPRSPPALFLSQEGGLSQLYQGEWRDYVQCTACLRESATPSKFGDLTLPIRTFAEPPVCLDSLECASPPRLNR